MLMVISDVSERLREERERKRQEQVVMLAQRFHRDQRATQAFVQETESLLAAIQEADDLPTVQRALHTAKGNASIYGLHALADQLHQLESLIQAEARSPVADEFAPVDESWGALMSGLAPFLESMADDVVGLSAVERDRLMSAIRAGAEHDELAQRLDWLCCDPIEQPLRGLADGVGAVARRLGRTEPVVEIESGPGRLRADRWQAFWAATVHLARNLVDHGLEPAAERVAAGKPERGRVGLRVAATSDQLEIRIRDDGRGIDWQKIAEVARARGLPSDGQRDWVEALFHEGLTTKEAATEFSGRGVGLSAVRVACQELGGEIRVTSEPGAGTEWTCTFPADPELWLPEPAACASDVVCR